MLSTQNYITKKMVPPKVTSRLLHDVFIDYHAGNALVTYSTMEEAQRALDVLDGQVLLHRTVKLRGDRGGQYTDCERC